MRVTAEKNAFTPGDVMRVVDISYRQMQYWDKTGFVCPEYRRARKYRLYSRRDVVLLSLMMRLRATAPRIYSIQRLRTIVDSVDELLKSKGVHPDAVILCRGDSILLIRGEFALSGDWDEYVIFRLKELHEKIEKFWPKEGELERIAETGQVRGL